MAYCPHHEEATTISATISSEEFNQDVGRAKDAAEKGPVLITDRGEPAFVLMRFEAYRQLGGGVPSIREMLHQPGIEEIEFEPPRFGAGHSGDAIPSQKPGTWDDFFAALEGADVPADFLDPEDRDQWGRDRNRD